MVKRFLIITPHWLLWATLTYSTGIVAARYAPTFGAVLAIAAAVGLLTALYGYIRQVGSLGGLVIPISILLGSFWFGVLRYKGCDYKHHRLSQHVTSQPFTGTARVIASQRHDHKFYTQALTLEILSPAPSRGAQIKLFMPARALPEPLEVDDIISVAHVVCKSNSNTPYGYYLAKEGVCGVSFTPKLEYTRITRPNMSLYRWLAQTQARVTQGLAHGLSSYTYALFCSIFLGSKPEHKASLDGVKDQFGYWGIVHYLARSGLHVVLLVMLWHMLLSFIPLPFMIKQGLMLIFISSYYLLTAPSISFIRACVTFVLYKLCIVRDLPIHTLHIVTLTSLLVLIYNPYQLYFLDFQLSFGLTLALAWYNETMFHRRKTNY